ncbi:MAG: hypothetical protein ACYTDU_21255 [Planctomycetota bacterium]
MEWSRPGSKEIEMAAKKKTKKSATGITAKKAARKSTEPGTVALVVRVPPQAITYIDAHKGDRPRTAFLRDVMAKGDARLGKILTAK